MLFVAGGSRHVIGLTLKPIADELGWNREPLGLAVALFFVISASCLFVSGLWADRSHPRTVMAVGALLSAVGIGGMSLIQDPWHAYFFYGGLFAMGSGVASIVPVGVMASKWFPRRTGFANAFAISGLSVGQLVVIAFLTSLLDPQDWRTAFVWLGIVNLCVLPIVLLCISKNPGETTMQKSSEAQHKSPPVTSSLSKSLRSPHLWLLVAIYAVCGFQDFFVSTHIVAFAQDRGVDHFFSGNLLALMGLTGLVGVIGAGLWGDYKGPMYGTLACFVLRIAVFALIYLDQSLPSIAVFALLYGSTFLVTAPLTLLFTRNAFGTKNIGTLTGLITMIHHMAGGLGAYIGAWSFDRTGSYDEVLLLMLVLSIITAGLTLMTRRPNLADTR
ncbi:MAG: MFS transporter [Methyloligellaceae bacterium]